MPKLLKTKTIDSTEKMDEKTAGVAGLAPKKSYTKAYIIIAVLILIGGLLYKNKSLFLVGMVGKTPIFKWQLDQALEQKYGKQEFDYITTELLIKKEADAKKVTVSQSEITDEVAKLEKSLNGRISLDEALKTQGITRNEFDSQVKMQILVSKLLADKTKVSDKEINDFIAQNKTSLTSSDPAEMKVEAKNNLQQQKLSQQFQTWLDGIKKNIIVQSFL